MNIGDAAKDSGVSAKMIRYYEEVGLITPPTRNANGYRSYAKSNIHELKFIRRARDLGFTVEQIAVLIHLWRDRSRASADVKRIALEHVAALEAKRREIEEMANTLRHLADNCQGDGRPDCPILENLAEGCGHASPTHLGKGFERLR
ncbi:MAG: Cu(I)-responsive transcriptional regulator [Hyphomicrobiales bacterium]|uniref:Cu(I)-responsive transcriptional regulator n=1 Tax=Aestuariivirga sp. TaxID=2650926 RepID=UPI0035B08970